MKPPALPKGWDEERVSELLAHYETQSDEGSVAEDESNLVRPWADRDGGSVQARAGGARAHRKARGGYLNSPCRLTTSSTAETSSTDTSGRLTTIGPKS